METHTDTIEAPKGRGYQAAVTVAGIVLWLIATGDTFAVYAWRDLLGLLGFVPLIIIAALFPIRFPLPTGWKFSQEAIAFTLIDAFVLSIAAWYGIGPAILVAGIEGFISSRRHVRRLSSNLFSSGMMSLTSAAASLVLSGVLGHGWGGAAIGLRHSVPGIAGALMLASVVQVTVNSGLLSTLLALRHRNSIVRLWKEIFVCAAPMFLPTGVAASLIFVALQSGQLATMAIGGPVLLVIYLGHRQNLLRAQAAQRAEQTRAEEAERHVAELSSYISEQKRILEQFTQIEKLSALGELASGVAHDFNNTLAGILGRAQLLHAHSKDSKEVERGLDIIIKTAKDGAHTVKRIQDFARQRRDHDMELVAVDQLLSDVSELTRPRWKNRSEAADVSITLDSIVTTTAMVMGDPSELREVLVNLVFNAVDAMPDGGRITLSAAEVDGQVEIRVTDNGTGMTDEVRAKIFDPFFTTKGKKGMGLGLAVSYGIICRHDGSLKAESEPGQGTSFVIRLAVAKELAPAVASETGSLEAAAIVRLEAGAGLRLDPPQPVTLAAPVTLRFLVVDDEAYVRELLHDILDSLGHHVVEAEDGFKALELLESQPFDAVFTDIGMPGMSGWELARLIRERNGGERAGDERNGELPVAVLTGWGDALNANEQKTARINWIVAKPFLLERIEEIVKEITELHRKTPRTNRRRLTLVA